MQITNQVQKTATLFCMGMSWLLVGCQGSIPSYFPETEFLTRPENLAQTIQKNYAQDPVLADQNISIVADEGRITLSGYVKTIRQYDTAFLLAQKTKGVKEVQNNLIIRR